MIVLTPSIFMDVPVQLRQFYDSKGSLLEEDRFLILGMSDRSRILMICHCERGSGDVIRLISARPATKNERKFYLGDLS